jgi:hypothetical protein
MNDVNVGPDEKGRAPSEGDILAALVAPRPAAGPLLAALLIGAAYALAVFGADFALGRSAFWDLPAGMQGGALDFQNVLAGYFWFAQAPWGWPLLHVPQANPPVGVNGYLFDFVPLAALLGKTLSKGTGYVLNPYPAWIVATFALNAASVAVLVRSFGQTSLLATILAGGLGAMMPMLHHRFGHIGHSAHWPFVLALAVLVMNRSGALSAQSAARLSSALTALSVSINIYVFAFAAIIGLTTIIQSILQRKLSPVSASMSVMVLLLPAFVLLWLFGFFAASGLTALSTPFGFYSMNVVSPFWPATSGVFSQTGLFIFTRGSIGATAGQYDGYAYLGIGTLLLLGLALLRNAAELPSLVRGYWVFALLLVAFTLYALSNTIYAFHIKLISYPVPDVLERTVLGWFRAGGRFFWPVAYTLVALAVAGALLRLRPRAAVVLALTVLLLQWADLSLWRDKLRDLTAAPRASAFGDQATWVSETIGRVGAVAVMPHLFCSAAGADYAKKENVATLEVQLIAARENATMSDVFVARGNRPCSDEVPQITRPTVLFVLDEWRHRPGVVSLTTMMSCRDVTLGLICSP